MFKHVLFFTVPPKKGTDTVYSELQNSPHGELLCCLLSYLLFFGIEHRITFDTVGPLRSFTAGGIYKVFNDCLLGGSGNQNYPSTLVLLQLCWAFLLLSASCCAFQLVILLLWFSSACSAKTYAFINWNLPNMFQVKHILFLMLTYQKYVFRS